MKSLRAFAVAALSILVAGSAFAETQNVKVSGSLDAYAIYRSNFDLRDGNDAGTVAATGTVPAGGGTVGSAINRSEGDAYFMSITQIQVSADMTDHVSTVINLINQRDWNADQLGGASLASNEFDVLLDLAYVQLKEIFYSPLTLTIGRQDLVFGRGFIVGWYPQDPQGNIQAEEFTQIQSFDAIRATLDFTPWTLDLVYSKIDENSTNPEDDSDLYIANVNYKFAEYNAVAEGYYVGQFDRNALIASTGNNDTATNSTNTIGGRLQFDPISQITLGGELAFQFGDYRTPNTATVATTERDREAWALDIFGEYRWDNTWKPMLGIEYVYLSGEEDLSSSSTQSYGSWNGAFRLPVYGWYSDYREGYYATGQTNDQIAGQNQQHVCLYGSIKPMEDLQLAVQYYHFWTADTAHTDITNPNTGSLSSHIGDEIDTTITYNYTEDVTFIFMADWFIPGEMFSSPNDATASQYISEVKVTF